MSKRNEPDFDDDLPPELEDIPEDVLPKKSSTKQVGQGNISLGDYAEPKPESVYIPPKEEEVKKEEPKKKESFGGIFRLGILCNLL